jgi:hypothetical protein
MEKLSQWHHSRTVWCISRSGKSARSFWRFGFRTGINCLALILLGGCADHNELAAGLPVDGPPTPLVTEPENEPAPPLPAKAHSRIKKNPAAHEAQKIKPDETLAALEPSTLLGKEPSAIASILGSPASIARSDVSLIWTYNYQGCAFQLYFYPDIKTSVFHALQYAGPSSTGGNVARSTPCVQHLMMARSNGTN